MTWRASRPSCRVALVALAVLVWPAASAAQTAKERYERAQSREADARAVLADAEADTSLKTRATTQTRSAVTAYEDVVRRFPRSGYSDNALFNAAALAEAVFSTFGEPSYRERAIQLYRRVGTEYPTSSLVRPSNAALTKLERATTVAATAAPAAATTVTVVPATTTPPAAVSPARAKLLAIDRQVTASAVRVTLQLDREVEYREELLAGPARVFFDLKRVEAAPELRDAVLRYGADAVRQIRVGRHPDNTVRVVLDLEGVKRHSVYTLYNPFRVVIECEPMNGMRAADGAPAPDAVRAAAAPAPAGVTIDIINTVAPRPSTVAPHLATTTAPRASPSAVTAPPLTIAADNPVVVSQPTVLPAEASPAPAAPRANTAGGFSLSRQLGLGVSRIVIDAGHGGHDPGAIGKGLTEAELTLDIALRLEKLLLAEPGIEVILTRRTNVFIPLEERTAIANREDADLFLSIHANASRNAAAGGIETYYLSFASSPDAEAVAARENSAGARTMHHLPDIVKAITLNNKLDESRDLAAMVQEALVSRAKRSHQQVRNLGVKKAPFVVLIGAAMPSVLAEVSFLTNRQELQLLKTPAYKQRLAEALHAAVMRYRRSLKGQTAIAAQ